MTKLQQGIAHNYTHVWTPSVIARDNTSVEEPVIASGSLSAEELSAFLRSTDGQGLRQDLVLGCAWSFALPWILFMLLAVYFRGADALRMTAFWVCAAACLPSLIAWIVQRQDYSLATARRKLEESTHLSSRLTYRFMSDRMEVETSRARAETPWSRVKKAVELEIGFVLFGPKRVSYVPKRFFRGNLDVDAFRVVLRGALGKRFSVHLPPDH